MSEKRRLSRREFLAAGTATLGAVALSACGGGSTPPTSGTQPTAAAPAAAQKVKLQWIEWITPEISEEKMQGVLNAFYQSEEGKSIEVERLAMPYAQIHDKVVALNLANTVPDILNMNAPWVVEFAEQGVLEPLNPYLEKEGKDWVANLVQGPMQQWKGNTYLVPLTSIPFLLYYNEKKLADAGFSAPPKTWAEVEQMGPKLTDPAKNTYCYASGMAATSPYNGASIEIFPLIYQSNDTVMKDSKCNLGSPAAAKALKFWIKLVNDLKIYAPGVLTNIEKDKLEAFGAEQTALMWSNVAHVTVVEQRNPNLKFGLAPLPEGDTFGTVLTGWNTSMAKNGKNKEATWQFIRWLTGPEGNAKMTIAAKHLPGNTKADVSEMFKADPRLKVPVDILAKGRVFLETAGMPNVTDLFRILVEQIHEAASNRKTPEEALQFAAKEWDAVLAKFA
ncbi:MAG: ABC transporter substrate-binding protein [Chloroflexota bacterium]